MTTMKASDVPEILELVKTLRTYGRSEHPIKYVDFSYDNRTCDVFSVTFRGWGGTEDSFHVMNEQRGLAPLKERVIDYLLGL